MKMAKYPSSYWSDINVQKSMKTSAQKVFNRDSSAFRCLRAME